MAASALPVGMLSPHVTRSPTPLSRLTEIGVPLAHRELQALLAQGQGWQACEVDNLGADAGRWPAALVRPSALVTAWLDEARTRTALTCHWSSPVATVNRVRSGSGQVLWQVSNELGQPITQAPVLVIAAALGSLGLAGSVQPARGHPGLPLRPVKGQLSLAPLDGAPLSPRPQRNQGVFVPCYEDSGLAPQWPSRLWAMGSTYERGLDNRDISEAAHARNVASLNTLNPNAARQMQAEQAAGRLMGWAEVRCASLDRLPLVGAWPDLQAWQGVQSLSGLRRGRPPPLSSVPRQAGLYALCALGSRGLSLAALCGQILARQLEGEADDLPRDLVDALDPARFAWRQARRPAGLPA